MWFKRNKIKIIAALVIIAVFAAAFYYGGDAPNSRGWEVSSPENSQSPALPAETPASATPAQPPEPSAAPEPSPEPSAAPELSPEPSAAPEPSPEPSAAPEPSPEPSAVPEPSPEPSAAPEPSPEPSAVPEPSSEPSAEPTPEPLPEVSPEIPEGTENGDAEEPAPPAEPPGEDDGVLTCTIYIQCETILNNLDLCDPAKQGIVPVYGWILGSTEIEFTEGETVFDVLQRVCKEKGIHMEYSESPMYGSVYIEGIANLYEFDVGSLSGWMYKVNGWFPNYGCSLYTLKDGDSIGWVYTCDLGYDVGGGYSTGGQQG